MTDGRGKLMKANRARIKREALQRDLLFTSSLLMDALALEQYCARRYRRRPEDEILRELSTCRRILKPLVHDYARLVAQYRKAVKAGISRTTPGRI